MVPAVQRVVWSGAVAAPALVILILPHWLGPFRTGHAAAVTGIAAATALTIVAALLSHHARRAPERRNPALLTRAARRRLQRDLPDPGRLREDLAALLHGAPARRDSAAATGPETATDALCRVLSRVLQIWRADSVAALDDTQLRALWLLRQLIAAPPRRAGELAQNFRKPDTVLEIRDRILEIDARRQRFERARPASREARGTA